MLFPTQSSLNEIFSYRHPLTAAWPQPPASQPLHIRTAKPQFSFWSVSEDAQSKANALSEESQREIKKARAAAQKKTGQIELYSAKYYAACIFRSLVACVGILETPASGLVAHDRRQVDSKIKGNFEAWGRIGRADSSKLIEYCICRGKSCRQHLKFCVYIKSLALFPF